MCCMFFFNRITLGNQLDGVRLLDPDVTARFKKRYPDGNVLKPPTTKAWTVTSVTHWTVVERERPGHGGLNRKSHLFFDWITRCQPRCWRNRKGWTRASFPSQYGARVLWNMAELIASLSWCFRAMLLTFNKIHQVKYFLVCSVASNRAAWVTVWSTALWCSNKAKKKLIGWISRS